jgi:hypothetical protein
MANKLHNWITRRAQNAQWIHKDKKGRIKFRHIYACAMLACFIIFLISVVLFYCWGLRFDPNRPSPYDGGTGSILFLVFGILLFVLITIITCLLGGVYFPMIYKLSREMYLQTDEYKQQVLKYDNEDLTKYKLKDLLWLRKLGWINKTDFDLAKTKKNKKGK